MPIAKNIHSYDTGQTTIDLPKTFVKDLGWEHLEKVQCSLEFVKGRKGIFVWKENKK